MNGMKYIYKNKTGYDVSSYSLAVIANYRQFLFNFLT